MINLTEEEVNLVGLIAIQIKNSEDGLRRQMAARDALIKLLETKYDAIFNQVTGQLEPEEEAK